jgi:hypothetical protein
MVEEIMQCDEIEMVPNLIWHQINHSFDGALYFNPKTCSRQNPKLFLISCCSNAFYFFKLSFRSQFYVLEIGNASSKQSVCSAISNHENKWLFSFEENVGSPRGCHDLDSY